MTISGANTLTGETWVYAGDALILTGTLPGKVVVYGGTLEGTGTAGSVVNFHSAAVQPDLTGAGTLHSGSFTLTQGSLFLNASLTAGGLAWSQVKVTGTVTLGDGSANGVFLNPNFQPNVTSVPAGDIVIIDNDGTDPVVGTFTGRPEGSHFIVNGLTYYISYHGGDGNDVVLSATPVQQTQTYVYYLSEGSTGGFFTTDVLLANPQTSANTAHVTYFREGNVPITRDYALGPQSRTTIDIGADAALVNRSFGMQVTFDAPGVAERSMYFGTSPFWSGGHESAGTTTLSYDWLLAEGATGPFFETFILLANPTSTDAQVTVTFLPQGATPVVKQKTVAANSRMTINIEGEDPTLGNAAVATQIHSTQPLVAERSQYWPDPAPQWSGQQRAGTGERELRRDHHLGPGDCRGALDVLRRHRPGLGRRHQRDSLTAAVTKVAAGGSPSAPDGGFIPVAGTAIGIAALELPAAPVLFSVQECPRPTVRNAAQ